MVEGSVDRATQVGRALANANVSGKRVSGIYIIWPGWSEVPFVKLGLTTNIFSRAMNGYSHYMPHAAPGNSFDLVGCRPQRVFSWSSLDTPEIVCTKWKAVMEPYVTFGGTSSSFGHALLNYDRETAWGGNLFTVYYEIYRYTAGDDASKVNLGLYTSPTLNMFWTFSMLKRYFPLVAKPAYSRLGVVADSKKRISVEVLATGSQGLNRRPIKFDITMFVDEFNSNLSFFNPAIAYTMIFSNSDIVYDILFFAGTTQIVVDPEASSNIAFYSQIYKPVLRFCGGVLVNSDYTGVICPISRISVITNKTRSLGLDDFTEKRLPTSIGHNSFFSGDLIVRSNNGVTYNIVDNLELLNSELLATESVTILSCTAASDSWIITTDNAHTPFQVLATPAYSPSVIGALSKLSPAFTGQTAIATDANWPITTGWRTSQSSIYDNNGAFIGWKSTDRDDGLAGDYTIEIIRMQNQHTATGFLMCSGTNSASGLFFKATMHQMTILNARKDVIVTCDTPVLVQLYIRTKQDEYAGKDMRGEVYVDSKVEEDDPRGNESR
ncbi:hypothetical protein T492DRAFT_1134111 [Pavlovales sp. CCMP2436]|nr:hypothetical protein T492DRAFT_1134111 [Pavlovales sp. CCMP2436]